MQNFNGKVRQYLKENERKRHSRLFGIVLSVVMTVSVLASLVMPAISATEGTAALNADVVYGDNTFVYKEASRITFKSYAPDPGASQGKDQTLMVDFNVNFQFDAGAMTSRFIYFPIGDNVNIPEGGIPSNGWGDVLDDRFDENNKVSGTYKVTEINGQKYLLIEFVPKYQEKNETQAIDGKASFSGNVKRKDKDTEGKTTVDIGGKTIDIEGFTPLTMSAAKTAEETEKGIRWTVTVDNPANKELTDISDGLFKDAIDGTFVVKPESAGNYDSTSQKFVFNKGFSEDTVSITYTTPYPIDDPKFVMLGEVYNKATVSDKEGNTAEANKTFRSDKLKENVSKVGTHVDYDNNEVTWTITVDNPSGADLNGYHLVDDAFKNVLSNSLTVKDAGGSDIKYKLSEDNTLTFDGSVNAKQITVEYKTALSDSESQVSNTVKMKKPDKKDPWTDKTATATVSNRYQINKDGKVNNSTGVFEWTITINKNDPKQNLKGETITDPMLKAGQTVIVKVDGTELEVTVADNGKIVLPDGVGDATKVEITYTTNATDMADNLVNPDGNGYYNVKNTAGIEGFESEKVVYYKPTNEKYKTINNVSQNGNTVTYKWQIEIKQVNGAFKNKTIRDVMSATSKDGTEIKSVFDKNSFEIYVQKNGKGSYETLDNSLYDVVPNGDNTSFDIVFKNDDALNEVNLVQIKYNSTVDVTKIDAGTAITVNNRATFDGDEFEPSADKKTFIVEKKDKTPYEKFDAASSTAGDTQHDLKSLPVVTIDGVDYYRFDWRLDINKNQVYKRGDKVEIVDTLPEGMILYENGEYLKYTTGDSDQKSDLVGASQFGYTYDKSANTITFETKWNQQDSWTAYYSTLVKTDDVKNGVYKNGTAVFKNTVQDSSKQYSEKTQTQTVKEKNVTKTSSPKSTGCEITYTVDVNPKKLKCSNSGMITLNDVIKCGGTAVVQTKDAQGNIQTKTVTINGNSAVDMDLKSIKVYDADTGEELTNKDFSYVISEPKAVDSTVACDVNVTNNSKGKFTAYFTPKESIVGAKGTIDIALPAGYEGGNIKNYYVGYGYMEGNSFKEITAFDNKSGYWKDFGDKVSVPVEIVSSENSVSVFKVEYEYRDSTEGNNTSVDEKDMLAAVKCSALTAKTRDYVKKLEITVPDQRHFKIVYVYTGSPANDEDAQNSGFKVNVFNTVSFDTVGSLIDDNADANDEFELINQSKASSTTVEPFKLVKVDSGDYSLMLNASFEIYKYAMGEDGNYAWLPAIDFTDNKAQDRKSVIWGKSDTGTAKEFKVESDGSCNLVLENEAGTGEQEGYLYKLIEKQNPDGYQLDDTPIYFAFKVQPKQLPTEVGEDEYQFIKNGDLFRVTNLLQEFSITASKAWSDGNELHVNDSVKFELGSSTEKGLDGDSDRINWDDKYTVTLGEKDGWEHKWTGLPGCVKQADGSYKQLYYYIKETSSASGYETIYSANAISRNTEVTVNNVKGLTITKEWRDELGNELADSELPNSINVIVYESDTAPNSPTRVNNEYGIPVDCKQYGNPITLKKAENWKHTLNDLNKDKYYYVLEESVPDGFGVTYTYSNNASGTGFDTIINTKTPKDIKEMSVRLHKAWSDSDTKDHANDKVTFNIYRSTNKNDVPTKYNKFTGTMDVGQNVKFKVLTTDGSEFTQSGNSITEYTMYDSGTFKFNFTNFWINDGENESTIKLIDSTGSTLAELQKTGTQWDGTIYANVPTWTIITGDSDLLKIGDYTSENTGSGFTLNLDKITSDVTVELRLKASSTSTCEITSSDPGTAKKTNVSTVPTSNPDKINDALFVKTVTIDATNDWSEAIKLEKNNIKGETYYYWIEEVEVNGQPVSTSAYKAYYRYNGSDIYNCIDTNGNDQYVQVYNNYEETVGELPETGGRGVLPFAVAGGAITAAATALLVTKRRKKHAENM